MKKIVYIKTQFIDKIIKYINKLINMSIKMFKHTQTHTPKQHSTNTKLKRQMKNWKKNVILQ